MKDFSQTHKTDESAARDSGPAASAAHAGKGSGSRAGQPTMADKLPEATVRSSSADTSAIAIQAAVVAQVLKQMGLGNSKENKYGPKPVHSKDLAPSDVKTFSGIWLEFANWWTMLKSTLAAASPEWRIILDRLLEYPKRRIAAEDLEHITGKSEVEAHLAYSNELFRIVHARTSGTLKGQVVVATEDKIFDVVKQWLTHGQDRTMFG